MSKLLAFLLSLYIGMLIGASHTRSEVAASIEKKEPKKHRQLDPKEEKADDEPEPKKVRFDENTVFVVEMDSKEFYSQKRRITEIELDDEDRGLAKRIVGKTVKE